MTATTYRTAEEVAAACREAIALAPVDLLPPLPPTDELLGAPAWYPFEIWPLGENVRQAFKNYLKLKRERRAVEPVVAVVECARLRRGRQSFVLALGFSAAAPFAPRIARFLTDSDIDGQVIDTLLKMKSPGFVDAVKPLREADRTWIRNLAKKYVARYSSTEEHDRSQLV